MPLVNADSPGVPADRPCASCGEGFLVPTNVEGSRFSYRDERQLEVGEALTLPVCTHCGDSQLDAANVRLLDAALERAYRTRRQGTA
jgi:hypothetical protein